VVARKFVKKILPHCVKVLDKLIN